MTSHPEKLADRVKKEETVDTIPMPVILLDKLMSTEVDDLNNDGLSDTIKLLQDTAGKNDGWFNKVIIKISGQKEQAFTNRDAWSDIDSSFLSSNTNAIKSKWVFAYKDTSTAFLILFGAQYELERSGTVILQINKHDVKKIFITDAEVISRFGDINGDGYVDMVINGRSEAFLVDKKGITTTYDPHFVYTLYGSTVRQNIQLSKTYNEEHYIWAGLHPQKQLKVFHSKVTGKYSFVK